MFLIGLWKYLCQGFINCKLIIFCILTLLLFSPFLDITKALVTFWCHNRNHLMLQKKSDCCMTPIAQVSQISKQLGFIQNENWICGLSIHLFNPMLLCQTNCFCFVLLCPKNCNTRLKCFLESLFVYQNICNDQFCIVTDLDYFNISCI